MKIFMTFGVQNNTTKNIRFKPKSQRKKLNDKLDDYASDLWKNKKKANMYDVENIVNGIAIR